MSKDREARETESTHFFSPSVEGGCAASRADGRGPSAALEGAGNPYVALYEEAPVAYWVLDEGGHIRQLNEATTTLFGVPRAELLGQAIQPYLLEEDVEILRRHLQLVLARQRDVCDLRLKKADGTLFWGRLRSALGWEAEGHAVYRVICADVTHSKQLEEALREQKDFFLQIAEHLSDFIAVLDLDGRRLYNSPSYRQFFGPNATLPNSDSFADIHPDDRERVRQVFRETVRSGQGHRIEYRFLKADGSVRDMESSGSLIEGSDGQGARVLVVSQDITERKRLQEQVHKMAFHDVLTGLPNRRLFSDRFHLALASAARSGSYGALMFLDLDNFKPLNDAYGHEVGDCLLIQAAERLAHCVREMDSVARFGGDEFVVMLSQLDGDQRDALTHAEAIAEKLRVALAEAYLLSLGSEPSAGTLVEHWCTVSIGVTVFGDRESNPGEILKRADWAMYQAKQAGGNQVRAWDERL